MMHVFTAKERKALKADMTPEQLEYVETLEEVAKEADKMALAQEEVTKARVRIMRALTAVNFMSHN